MQLGISFKRARKRSFMKTKILPGINSYDGTSLCGCTNQFPSGPTKPGLHRRSDNKMVLLAGNLLLAILLFLLGSTATTCGTLVPGGGTIYTGGSNPATNSPAPDPCPPAGTVTKSYWYYTTGLQDEEVDTYLGGQQEEQTFYQEVYTNDMYVQWQWVSAGPIHERGGSVAPPSPLPLNYCIEKNTCAPTTYGSFWKS